MLQISDTHTVDEHVADLLQQDDDARGRVVVLGVGPDEADDVQEGRDQRLHLAQVRLLQVLQVVAQGLQMQVNVARLR